MPTVIHMQDYQVPYKGNSEWFYYILLLQAAFSFSVAVNARLQFVHHHLPLESCLQAASLKQLLHFGLRAISEEECYSGRIMRVLSVLGKDMHSPNFRDTLKFVLLWKQKDVWCRSPPHTMLSSLLRPCCSRITPHRYFIPHACLMTAQTHNPEASPKLWRNVRYMHIHTRTHIRTYIHLLMFTHAYTY